MSTLTAYAQGGPVVTGDPVIVGDGGPGTRPADPSPPARLPLHDRLLVAFAAWGTPVFGAVLTWYLLAAPRFLVLDPDASALVAIALGWVLRQVVVLVLHPHGLTARARRRAERRHRADTAVSCTLASAS